ncbi:class I SAM-dependent methyltransferase [Micromonospora sp. CPCC 206060]|uniref:class I SAM-dependent methyltransferase n=1 Tax=Micromonospora sp. CPCC 206060 TaxID=3122406 RepID=UPI002FF08C03
MTHTRPADPDPTTASGPTTQRFPAEAVRATYDTVAEPYADQFADELDRKPFDRALVDGFAALVRAGGDPAPVADLGCGPAHTTRYLADLGLPVVGVDLSPQMVRTARRRYPGLDIREGSILDLDAPSGSFAGVLALYSVIHLPRPVLPTALREFHRVLRPGGTLLLSFHVGTGTLHQDTWFDRPVSIDGHLFDPDDVAAALADVGLGVQAQVRRRPWPDIEVPTERAYLLARRPAP